MVLGAVAVPAAAAAAPRTRCRAGGRAAPSRASFRREELWACTTCMACMDSCPVFNEHIPLIVEMRRHLVAQGALEDRVQERS